MKFFLHFKKLNLNGFKALYTGVWLLLITIVLLGTVLFSLKEEKNQQLAKQETVKAEVSLPPTPLPPPVIEMPSAEAVSVIEEQPAVSPLKGKVLLAYGWQLSPVYQDWRFHTGVDMAAKEGEEITAVMDGKVTEISEGSKTGLMVAVENPKYTCYYGSLSAAKVAKGTQVKRGQVVGIAGSCPAEPAIHLHFAVKQQGQFIDPAEIF